MKKHKIRHYFFYIALFGGYLIITLLISIILHNVFIRRELDYRYEMEREATLFFENLDREISAEMFQDRGDKVTGFGTYRIDGTRVVGWGSAPGNIREELRRMALRRDPGAPFFIYDNSNRKLRFVRPIGRRHSRMMNRPNMMRHENQVPTFLFLEWNAGQQEQAHAGLTAVRLALPVLLFAIVLAIAYLYRKNRGYKAQLASQEELVRLGEISRTLSHEIKNPLSAIRMQTGLLKRMLPANQQEEIAIIDEEIIRLKLLTERISDFLRDPAGKPVKIHLPSFLADLIKRFSFPVHLESHLYKDVNIIFDRDRLRSVVENIIKNSVESYVNGATGSVVIEIIRDEKRTGLLISDRGAGIPTADMQRVFDTNYSTKKSGTGIGLAIVKRFVEAGGGTVTLSAGKTGGLVVRIMFGRK